MKIIPLKNKHRETLLSGIVSMLLMVGILAFLMMTGYLFAANMDEHIDAAARKSYVFKTYLKGAEIQIHSRDVVATLKGTVAERSH